MEISKGVVLSGTDTLDSMILALWCLGVVGNWCREGLASPLQDSCVSCPAGLVSWWRAELNADDCAGSNNGKVFGGVSFEQGVVGQAFSFQGNEMEQCSCSIRIEGSRAMPFSGEGHCLPITWATSGALTSRSGSG
jgi:hypothetical protein